MWHWKRLYSFEGARRIRFVKNWNTHSDSDSKDVELYQAITTDIIIINTALGMGLCFADICKNILKDRTKSIGRTRENEPNEKEWKLYIVYFIDLQWNLNTKVKNTNKQTNKQTKIYKHISKWCSQLKNKTVSISSSSGVAGFKIDRIKEHSNKCFLFFFT